MFAARKEKKTLSQTNLGGPIYSTPVAANGVLYVHSNTHLFAFYDSEHKRMASDEKPKGDLELAKPDRLTNDEKNLGVPVVLGCMWPIRISGTGARPTR